MAEREPDIQVVSSEEYFRIVSQADFTAYVWDGERWLALGERADPQECFRLLEASPFWPCPAHVTRSCYQAPTGAPTAADPNVSLLDSSLAQARANGVEINEFWGWLWPDSEGDVFRVAQSSDAHRCLEKLRRVRAQCGCTQLWLTPAGEHPSRASWLYSAEFFREG